MFRALGKSKIAFVLAILFGISLFFFKGGSRYSNFFNSDTVVATVSGTPISTTKFNRTMKMNINKFNQMLGKPITKDEIRAFQIHSLALGALVNDAVFENEYDKMNLRIDETIIAKKTQEKIPQLYDKNNQLNETYLNTFLKQQQLKIEDVVQIIDFETRDAYINDAFFKINYPEYFANKISKYNQHQRKIIHIELPLSKVDIENTIQEQSSNMNTELQNFYDKNINQYMSKESRNIEYILIDKKSFASMFNTSDFEIKEYYDSNKDLYYENEKRSFTQFNFKSITEAKNFQSTIKDFDTKQILEYSLENNIRFKKFQNIESNQILEVIATPLFKLNLNEKSNIIETSIDKNIILLHSISPSKQLKLEDVKEDIKKTITSLETNNYFLEIINQISEKVLNGESLNEIANKFNFKIEIIKNLTKDYKKYDVSQENIYLNLISSAFSANKDFVSDIVTIDENYAYLFNVQEIDFSSPLIFNSIRERILKDWKIAKKIEKIKLEIEENKININFVTKLSQKYQLELKENLIDKSSNALPRDFINNIFEAEKNNNVQSIDNNTVHIANITQILIKDIDKNAVDIKLIENDLRRSFGQEIMKNKKISTNDSLINAIIEQY